MRLPVPEEAGAGAFQVNVARVGTATLPTGDEVPVVRLTLATERWSFDADLTGPHAIALADLLREAAGGLTIAQTLEGIEQ